MGFEHHLGNHQKKTAWCSYNQRLRIMVVDAMFDFMRKDRLNSSFGHSNLTLLLPFKYGIMQMAGILWCQGHSMQAVL